MKNRASRSARGSNPEGFKRLGTTYLFILCERFDGDFEDFRTCVEEELSGVEWQAGKTNEQSNDENM